MLPLCALMSLLPSALEGDADLAAAESAYVAGRYDIILPALDKAQAHPLPRPEEMRAWELRAVACAALERSSCAVESYRHVIGLDANYSASSRAGPKLESLLHEAIRLGPLPKPMVITVEPRDRQAPLEPLKPEPALYQKGWFWVVVGALAAGAAVAIGAVALNRPLPPANLGRETLR